MFSSRYTLASLFVIACVLLSACNLPSSSSTQPAPTTTTGQNAPGVQETATPQPVAAPSNTAAPEATATITETPTLEFTATAEATQGAPQAVVAKVTNCRVGPGSMYDLVATYQSGQKVEIVANDLGGGFVYVKNLDKPEETCWVLANNITITGDTSGLPAFTPPPSPTAAPSFTVDYKNTDTCKGDVYLRFIITNTGSFPFRSAYIKVTNIKTGKFVEQSVNAFDLTTGCIIAKNIAPLGVGGTGYLNSGLFLTDPRGSKLRAVFMLCTEQGLKGACVTRTLDNIKP